MDLIGIQIQMLSQNVQQPMLAFRQPIPIARQAPGIPKANHVWFNCATYLPMNQADGGRFGQLYFEDKSSRHLQHFQ